ncbi:MAG: tRNA lysidine(34) synthetase TilS [Thermodesulfovibrionales bacterium]
MGLLKKVSSTIKKHSMLCGDETVLVGLSGGPDSVCLLVALRKLFPGLKLHALYIDHGLRPGETPGEIAFCRGLCETVGAEFSTREADVRGLAEESGMGKQEAARELRYHILEAEALRMKATRIALGHNLDDQVETFFMRVLRGTGPRGLMAIPPVRGKIIRPLVDTGRTEIEGFLREEGVGHVVDSSNLAEDYLRNRIRHRLMPVLRELDPGVMDTLGRTMEIIREEERHMEVAVTKALMKIITRKGKQFIELFSVPLESMDRVILRRVLRRAVEETAGLRGIGFTHVEDIIELASRGRPGDRITLPRGIRAVKKYSTLLITSEPPARIGPRVLEGEGTAEFPEAGVAVTARIAEEPPKGGGPERAVLDAGKAPFPLVVRPRRDGDHFYPSGFGRRKKLQDFFVDEKVPRDERDSVPVVESGGEIVWVAGMRADERFMPSEGTRRFLVLELRRTGRP